MRHTRYRCSFKHGKRRVSLAICEDRIIYRIGFRKKEYPMRFDEPPEMPILVMLALRDAPEVIEDMLRRKP